MNQKLKYLSKTVPFGGKELKLFSLDGLTWSTRKDELLVIKERHDAEKVTAAQLKGEPGESGGPAVAKPTKRLFNPRFQQQQPSAPVTHTHPAAELIAAKKNQNKKESAPPKSPAKAAPVSAPSAKKQAAKQKAAPKARSSSKPKKTAKSKRAAA